MTGYEQSSAVPGGVFENLLNVYFHLPEHGGRYRAGFGFIGEYRHALLTRSDRFLYQGQVARLLRMRSKRAAENHEHSNAAALWLDNRVLGYLPFRLYGNATIPSCTADCRT